ncbi:MAG: MAPEG family protein [Alphaproteobacteria bacterium]
MSTPAYLLAASVILTWVMLVCASVIRSRSWTPAGMLLAFGNRDNLTPASPAAARADRAAKNMLENLPLFAALLLGAWFVGVPAEDLAVGSHLFFWARLAYFPVYLVGIPYLRTGLWAVSVVGMAIIAVNLFSA